MIIPKHQNRIPSKVHYEKWEIRLGETDFNRWKNSMNELCLFFDGASKGNPGLAGCGGVLTEANGNVVSKYSWGLGIETNNHAEFCGLYQGLRIARAKGIAKILVFWDSRLLIQDINKKKHPSQLQLAQIFHKIHLICKSFLSIGFYHVLRDLNSLADCAANEGTLLGRGLLHMDEVESRWDIP